MTETKKPEEQQAAKPPEPKYRTLVPGDYVARCSYILPNQLQCWKAGEEEVLEKRSDGSEVVFQLCERHARIRRAIDAGTMKPEVVATAMGEMITEPPASSPDPKDEKAFEGIEQTKPVQEVEPAKVPPKSEAQTAGQKLEEEKTKQAAQKQHEGFFHREG